MTFRELLEKYKNGTATEAERALVEEELEKSEAISDYLAEGLEELENGGDAPSATDMEVKQVKRTVNRRLRRTALWAAAMVLAAVLVVQFVVNPLVSSFYYRPDAQTVGQNEAREKHVDFVIDETSVAVDQTMTTEDDGSDVEVDLTAFYELMMPGLTPTNIQTEAEGFGRYTITYEAVDGLTGTAESMTQKLRPGSYGTEVQGSWGDYTLSMLDHTAPALNPEEGGRSNSATQAMEHLTMLPETAFVAAWVHFPEDLTCVQFAKLADSYESGGSGEIFFRWAGVRVSDWNASTGSLAQFLGIVPEDAAMEWERVSPSWEKYPMFDYWQYLAEGGRSCFGDRVYMHTGVLAEEHFKSVLAYAADRTEAVQALAGPIQEGTLWDFDTAQSYIEENGVRIGGALVYSEPQALLRLYENGEIDNLSLEQVLPSRYSAQSGFHQ